MFSIHFNSQEVFVRFHYPTDSFGSERRVTECVAEVGEKEERKVIAKGIAVCHDNDRFQKAVGRKIAFARLLQFMKINKEERTKIWKLYHEKCKRPV